MNTQTSTLSIEQGNKIIGDFMGKNFKDPLNYMYDNDWNMLIPVVHHINIINFKGTYPCNDLQRALIAADIELVWFAVIGFIKWYNEKKPA